MRISAPAEVELKERKTRDRKASRNSLWISTTKTLRKHKMLKEFLRWAGVARQVGSTRGGAFFLLALIFWLWDNILLIVFVAFMFIFLCILYYKNVSFMIAKRLLRETNVVIIILLSLCNAAILILHDLAYSNIQLDLYLYTTYPLLYFWTP